MGDEQDEHPGARPFVGNVAPEVGTPHQKQQPERHCGVDRYFAFCLRFHDPPSPPRSVQFQRREPFRHGVLRVRKFALREREPFKDGRAGRAFRDAVQAAAKAAAGAGVEGDERFAIEIIGLQKV